MIDLQTSVNGMNARIRKQEVIANNLANVNTVGFKKDRVTVFREIMNDVDTVNNPDMKEGTVYDQGALRETNNPLDLALDGKGFFVLQTDRGMRYTRNGNFQIDASGFMVLDEGEYVMGESGPIAVQDNLQINDRGDVFQNNTLIDRLKVVTFPEPYPLKKAGGGLFMTTDDSVGEDPIQQTVVRQGFLEESNVNAIEEMVNMMTLYRYFEADQKVIRTQDDILNRAVNDIGAV